jgi:hypothetical protein
MVVEVIIGGDSTRMKTINTNGLETIGMTELL